MSKKTKYPVPPKGYKLVTKGAIQRGDLYYSRGTGENGTDEWLLSDFRRSLSFAGRFPPIARPIEKIKGKSANILIVDDPWMDRTKRKALIDVPEDKEVNPFGRLHDYLSLSYDDEGFELSDGTHKIRFLEFSIVSSSNWSKPFAFTAGGSTILLTSKQLEKFFAEYVRLHKAPPKEEVE